MKKINSSLFALALAAGSFSSAALAQDDATVMVDVSTLSPEIAAELGIDAHTVPAFVDLSLDAALDACGLDADDFGDITSCEAFSITADLLAAVEAERDGDGDGDTGDGDVDDGEGGDEDGSDDANPNSARDFAPGQQDGPANEFAPGHQDGPANESAPGQLKKNADQSDDETDEDTSEEDEE